MIIKPTLFLLTGGIVAATTFSFSVNVPFDGYIVGVDMGAEMDDAAGAGAFVGQASLSGAFAAAGVPSSNVIANLVGRMISLTAVGSVMTAMNKSVIFPPDFRPSVVQNQALYWHVSTGADTANSFCVFYFVGK